jgi:hypothetical protein
MGWLIDPDERTIFVYQPKQQTFGVWLTRTNNSCPIICKRVNTDCWGNFRLAARLMSLILSSEEFPCFVVDKDMIWAVDGSLKTRC